ncbi:MAG: family 1 glycosylhydrolase [Thermoproteus sp.]
MKIGAAISPYQHFGICGCDLPDEIGARHIQFYEDDIDLAKKIGLDVFRTGAEWGLLEPKAGHYDLKWASFFQKYFAYIKERGLELWLTAHHFTNPPWIWKEGGWESKNIVSYFLKYIDFILRNFNKYIDILIIFNEPEIYVYLSYLKGDLPPYGFLAYKHAARAFENIKEAIVSARDLAKSYGVASTFTHPYRKYRAGALLKPLEWILSKMSPSSFKLAEEMDLLAVNFYIVTEISLGDFVNVLEPEALLDLRGRKVAVTEYGIATRNEEIREAYLCKMSHIFREVKPITAIWWSFLHGYEWGLGYKPFFALLDENRRPTRLALKMRKMLEAPPDTCGPIPRRLGLEWRVALEEG